MNQFHGIFWGGQVYFPIFWKLKKNLFIITWKIILLNKKKFPHHKVNFIFDFTSFFLFLDLDFFKEFWSSFIYSRSRFVCTWCSQENRLWKICDQFRGQCQSSGQWRASKKAAAFEKNTSSIKSSSKGTSTSSGTTAANAATAAMCSSGCSKAIYCYKCRPSGEQKRAK